MTLVIHRPFPEVKETEWREIKKNSPLPHIFEKLSVQSLLDVRKVCKLWERISIEVLKRRAQRETSEFFEALDMDLSSRIRFLKCANFINIFKEIETFRTRVINVLKVLPSESLDSFETLFKDGIPDLFEDVVCLARLHQEFERLCASEDEDKDFYLRDLYQQFRAMGDDKGAFTVAKVVSQTALRNILLYSLAKDLITSGQFEKIELGSRVLAMVKDKSVWKEIGLSLFWF